MNIIDLSFDIDNSCMTCGTPWHEKVRIKKLGEISSVGRNTTSIKLGSHSGTHIDSPNHFLNDDYGVDQLDLNILCGKITVIDFTHFKQGMQVKLEDVMNINVTERILFRFGWHRFWKTKEYYKDFPFFSIEAAEYLVKSGIKLIALDTPSPDSGQNIKLGGKYDSPVHKLFLENEIIIIEYLTNTDKINCDKKLKIVALPLKLKGIDGSPARVIIMEE